MDRPALNAKQEEELKQARSILREELGEQYLLQLTRHPSINYYFQIQLAQRDLDNQVFPLKAITVQIDQTIGQLKRYFASFYCNLEFIAFYVQEPQGQLQEIEEEGCSLRQINLQYWRKSEELRVYDSDEVLQCCNWKPECLPERTLFYDFTTSD